MKKYNGNDDGFNHVFTPIGFSVFDLEKAGVASSSANGTGEPVSRLFVIGARKFDFLFNFSVELSGSISSKSVKKITVNNHSY